MSGALDERFLDVNAQGVLRVPTVLWLGLAVLARHWVLMVMLAVSMRSDPSLVRVLGENGIPWLMLGLQFPALLVALAGAQRRPEAGSAWRWLWRCGREVLAATAVANIAWTVHLLVTSDYWQPWPELFLGSCALIDLTVVVSLYTTPLLRQLFREFPARPSKESAQ